ncbi:NAD(P)-binding protein [Dichomitus squalens]|uniref:NAD(P)-binding protein n=1 Tax=Dichomitus squalens TaxID=114155 RepID=A0A4Q9PIR2_9APHY|nr:NAD(P)-binding protein [Dichomitus squalens]TBU53946.1 NAD(P)-binding protein [Dichomitus squalens]
MSSTTPHDISNSRVWFITGSNQGLGRALLEAVLASGERAVATTRRPETLSELSQRYPLSQLLVVPLDVTDEEQIKAAFKATKDQFRRLDVVVNNAGYGIQSEIEGTPERDARRIVETLFWGAVHVTKEAIPLLRDMNPPGHGGRILNISSVGGYIGNATRAFYNAGKLALEGFTEAFTKEMLPEWNIRGIIIQPGGFRTEWGGTSMLTLPMPPQYDRPDSPSVKFRALTQNAAPFIGDPHKAALAIMTIASLPDPPLRIQLGTDAALSVRNKAMRTISDTDNYEELSHSTNADDVDREKVMERLRGATRADKY